MLARFTAIWLLVLSQYGAAAGSCPTGPVLDTLTLEQQIQLVYVGLLERGASSRKTFSAEKMASGPNFSDTVI